jgi:hypothetical protein
MGLAASGLRQLTHCPVIANASGYMMGVVAGISAPQHRWLIIYDAAFESCARNHLGPSINVVAYRRA